MSKKKANKVSKTEKIETVTEINNHVQDKTEIAKNLVLTSLDDTLVTIPFVSERMIEVLYAENKIVNFPEKERKSGYESLPFTLPYDEKFQDKGFSGSRGRVFLSLLCNFPVSQIIAFDMYNRKIEQTQLRKRNIKRKINAIAKAYFPYLDVKTLYPNQLFKD